MAVKNEEEARKRMLAEEYSKKIRDNRKNIISRLPKEQKAFAENYNIYRNTKLYTEFEKALKSSRALPSECIKSKFSEFVEGLVPKSHKEALFYFADHIREYPYSVSYGRRSFRSISYVNYINIILNTLHRYSHQFFPDVPIDSILSRELDEAAQAYFDIYSWNSGYTYWQIAYALDMHDPKVEEALSRIITEKNGAGMLTTDIIRGVLCSHRQDYYDLLCKLLLAARLEEGLRQAICENADCGTAEGFKTILKVIEENDLIRFSSVKRALGTWLGIMTEEAKDLERISQKSLRLILDCLNDADMRDKYLASKDTMEIYIALWSYGSESAESAVKQVEMISKTGTNHQLLTAGYFAHNLDATYISNKIAKTVIREHNDKDDILAIWLPSFLPGRMVGLGGHINDEYYINGDGMFESEEEISEFYDLTCGIYKSSAKNKTFSPCVFPWHEAKLLKSDLAELLCTIAVISNDNGKIDECTALIKECDPNRRAFCLKALLRRPNSEIQRRALLEGIADKATYARDAAFRIAINMNDLTEDEYKIVEGLLRFKGADIRTNAIKLIMRRGEEGLKASISRMLESSSEEVRCGALDIITQLKNAPDRASITGSFNARLEADLEADKLTSRERLLVEALLPKKEEAPKNNLFSPEDKYLPSEFDKEYIKKSAETFLRYFPNSKLPSLICPEKFKSRLGDRISDLLSGECESCKLAKEDVMSLSELFYEHRYDTFENSYGRTVLLSDHSWLGFGVNRNHIPFAKLWDSWYTERKITPERLLRMIVSLAEDSRSFSVTSQIFGKGFDENVKCGFDVHIRCILNSFISNIPAEDLIQLAFALAVWFVRCVPNEDAVFFDTSDQRRYFGVPVNDVSVSHLLSYTRIAVLYKYLICKNDETLPMLFPAAVASAEKTMAAYHKKYKPSEGAGPIVYGRSDSVRSFGLYGYFVNLVGIEGYILAAYRGIISERALYEFVFSPDSLKESLNFISNIASALREWDRVSASHGRGAVRGDSRRFALVTSFLGHEGEWSEEDLKLLTYVEKIYENVIPVILASEVSRADSPAEYSAAVTSISRIYGVNNFVSVLVALSKDTLSRDWSLRNGYYYGTRTVPDRRSTLCHLLQVCVPEAGDTAEKLKKVLEGKEVITKRLVEAALYSPEWIELIGEYFGISSFESVCYYFMAHMNDQFDDRRKAMIARFTPLSADELNAGAFDIRWFREAYNSVSEVDFNFIYDAAKYITDGAKHSRARKYADAALGKLNIGETEKTISDKRNKDLLMAYPLIPIKDESDICRRYLFIQNFRKESKKFGSQRISSEGKASDMALTNLALNAGYSDTMRLTLSMETKVIDESRELLDIHIIDGVTLKLEIGDDGKTELVCSKDGKALKSIPAKLKKDQMVTALTEMKKTLTEQYRRTKVMLEEAMEDGSAFTINEISALRAHPVVYPMIEKLVFICGDISGFPGEQGLVDLSGTLHILPEDEKAKIAHPFDLYQSGEWQSYQKYLFENQIAQPFRQVFRELYVKTEDEINTYHSLRYAGNQIQPAKTVSVLKKRRWIADIEDGLQKVYYKENIVAQIYALADWFSPADIEAPTLEWVRFSDRQTGKEMKISDVPDIIFSEVMRDVDLAVSVAHAGNVDPETSHSTIEMRHAIISFVLPMFRIENVVLKDRHAIISGKFAEYSVHLGSGVVHQIGGAMIPVLPVHSQQRGKVFLPFVDDDPKTAEIISKILLFAEDGKIKDPTILSCIQKNI